MEQQFSYIEYYRSLVSQFSKDSDHYMRNCASMIFSSPNNGEDEYGIQVPANYLPTDLTQYYKLRELKMKITALEAARERIVKAVEYCLKSIVADNPIDVREYQRKVLLFKHWKNQIQLNGDLPLTDPRMFEAVAEQAANGLFDMSGGEFCAVQAEHTNGRLTVYLIK